jgi:putative oxidoreductase
MDSIEHSFTKEFQMFAKVSNVLVVMPSRIFASLSPLLLLGIRLWVGWAFLKSGLLKIGSWQSTLFLFREEYHVPFLPSGVAAVVGTAGELAFPILLFAGIAGRLSALGLFAVNLMAVVSYAHVLLAEGFEAALAQHYLWGFALLVVAVFGPGKLSVDHLWMRYTEGRDRSRPAAQLPAHAV